MTAVAGIGEDQTGVGLAEVVVPGKEAAAVLGLGGEGGAADLRSLQADVDKPLGQVAGDEGDKVAVAGGAALGQEIVKVIAAGDGHLVDGTVQVVVVPFHDLLKGQQGSDLISPQDPHSHRQDDYYGGQGRQQNEEDLLHSDRLLLNRLFAHENAPYVCWIEWVPRQPLGGAPAGEGKSRSPPNEWFTK